MADSSIPTGDEVFCHQCQSQWRRVEHGLQCPNCESEFTEILEGDPEPHERIPPAPPTAPNHPFHDHNPWEAPDPDEDDITSFEFTTGPSRITFASTTVRSGGRFGGPNMRGNDPSQAQTVNNFQSMLTQIMGGGHGPMPEGFQQGPPGQHTAVHGFPGHQPPPGMVFGGTFPLGSAGFGGRTVNDATGRIWPQEPRNAPPQEQMDPLQQILGTLFQGLAQVPRAGEGDARAGPGGPMNPFMLLGPLFGNLNPANAAHGDAVFTQEALDRVISQLMEQNVSSNAPGPASEAAIHSLPKKRVDQDVLGSDGKAECSICMDNVIIGDEVTVLPCTHWFHGDCVTSWLKEHDTCPHCRSSIMKESAARPTQEASGAQSPAPEGSSRNPYVIPGSPERASRYEPYEHRSTRSESGEWRETFERPRQSSRQNTGRSNSGSNAGGDAGGGITGRMRNWFGGNSGQS